MTFADRQGYTAGQTSRPATLAELRAAVGDEEVERLAANGTLPPAAAKEYARTAAAGAPALRP